MAAASEDIGRSDAAGAFVLRFVGVIATFALTYLISRGFGREALGRFGFGVAVLQLGAVFGKLGYDQAAMKLIAEAAASNRWQQVRNLHRSALGTVLVASVAVSTILIATSGPIVDRFFSESVSLDLYRFAALGIGALALAAVLSAIARSLGSLLLFSFGRFAVLPVAGLIGVGVLASTRPDGEPFHAYLLAVVLSVPILWFAVARKLRALPDSPDQLSGSAIRTPREDGMALRAIALPLAVASAGLVALPQIDVLFLGAFHTDADVGDFNAALRLAALVSLPLVVLNAVAAPRLAVAHSKNDIEGLARTTQALALAVLVLSVPTLVILAIYREPILGLFGDEFRGASTVLLILCAANAVSVVCGPTGTLLSMTDRQRSFQTLVLGALVIGVIAHLVLTPRFGASGAAMVQLITMAVWNVGAVVRSRQAFGFWPVATARSARHLRSLLTGAES